MNQHAVEICFRTGGCHFGTSEWVFLDPQGRLPINRTALPMEPWCVCVARGEWERDAMQEMNPERQSRVRGRCCCRVCPLRKMLACGLNPGWCHVTQATSMTYSRANQADKLGGIRMFETMEPIETNNEISVARSHSSCSLPPKGSSRGISKHVLVMTVL